MNEKDLALHYVRTRDKAWELVNEHSGFWVSNCGCRESRGKCDRSRMDVCLMFREDSTPSGSGFKEISRIEVKEIFKEAEEKHLVCRPFRDEKNMKETEGICFCCDDCCGYFLETNEKCDKGDLIEKTDLDECSNCGVCVEVCYFGAREMDSEALIINKDNCYGCGLCLDVCPEDCIGMVSRK